MWGGSYAGYDQWATAKEMPPHLATIVPAAAAHPGVDFPFFKNVFSSYIIQWLTFTSGGHAERQALRPLAVLDRAASAPCTCDHRPYRELDEIDRQRLDGLPGLAPPPDAGRLLGRDGADARAVREAEAADPHHHRPLRRRPARGAPLLPPAHAARDEGGARPPLPDHGPLGPRRHAHAAEVVRRPDLRRRQPPRPQRPPPAVVRLDDEGRQAPGVPEDARRLLRGRRRGVEARRRPRGDRRGAAHASTSTRPAAAPTTSSSPAAWARRSRRPARRPTATSTTRSTPARRSWKARTSRPITPTSATP